MKKTDSLIVGQGIAGSLVAFMLHQRKIPFKVIDAGNTNTSSIIAAGMFTPISGKRKTIRPAVIQQINFAIKTYKEIGQLLGSNILHQVNIYQVYNSIEEKNELARKLVNLDFAKYILTATGTLPGIKQEFGVFGIAHSGWVDCGLMIGGFAHWLKESDALIEARFSHKDLRIGNDAMEYNGIEFRHIFFCEGWMAINNPFFDQENIIPCKGDILTIKYAHPVSRHIIKRNGIYLIPTGNDIFKAGSTYHWKNNDLQPGETDKRLIEDQIDAIFENKYVTIDHKSAIRPTTKNREVIAKQHPEHAGMFMLNGLGTRGILQGPWWAKEIVELCLQQTG